MCLSFTEQRVSIGNLAIIVTYQPLGSVHCTLHQVILGAWPPPNPAHVQFSSVPQSCPTLCNPMKCSTSGFPVHHQLPKLAQIHARVGDAIQPSHPLSFPSPPAFSSFQHQARSFPVSRFFTSSGQPIGASASASVLPMKIQDWFLLRLVWSPCSPGDSQESSPTPRFESINYLVLSHFYGSTLTSLHD